MPHKKFASEQMSGLAGELVRGNAQAAFKIIPL